MTTLEQARQDRINVLKQKLAARDGNPAYKENCDKLRAEIQRLEWSNL